MHPRSHSRKNDSYLQKSALSSADVPPPSPGPAFVPFPFLLSALFAVFEFDQHRIADFCRFHSISSYRVGDGWEKLLLMEEDDNCLRRIRVGGREVQSLWRNGAMEKQGLEEGGCYDGSAAGVAAAAVLDAPGVVVAAVAAAAVEAYLLGRGYDALSESDRSAASSVAAQELQYRFPSPRPQPKEKLRSQ
jgi:hypothetical protein